MRVLSDEKIRVLAERNSWPPAYAQGFIDGEMFRRRGALPSKYAQVGIDEYCLGFRAGYYERNDPDPKKTHRIDSPVRMRRTAGRP